MRLRVTHWLVSTRAGLLCAFAGTLLSAAEPNPEVRELIEQNRRLQEQVRAQQKTIDELSAKVGDLARSSERQQRDLQALQDRGDVSSGSRPPSANRDQEVRIGAEAGLAYFKTGADGQYPTSTFRVDDPVITVEAPVFKDVYFYTELKLLTRETNVENFELGEMYVDFENLSAAWGQSGVLSFRMGRLQIPFGEEYQVRGPVANPLISHSLSDLWGVDEGAEIYGRLGPLQYVLAVQNGGKSRLMDFNSDKSVTARLGFAPAPGWHVSVSGMRTGELDAVGDNLSELWFGNGFFRSVGAAATTRNYWADLYEADGSYRWRSGQVLAAVGAARYDDDDRAADNSRRLRYGTLELVQDFSGQFYGAARYSVIRSARGYPLAGWGKMGTFFFRPVFATELERVSVGLGYRIAPPLVLKFEYTWESGQMTNGASRDHENFFGSELVVKF